MATSAGISQTLPFGKSKVYRFIHTQLLTFCRLNFSNPTILNLDNSSFNDQYAVISEDYNHGFVYLIITSQNTTDDKNKSLVPAAHPIHLHGHDFVILGQGNTTYSVTNTPKTFNYNNPPRRDVALLPTNGYLAIAFKPDNPGVWLVHCHIGKFPSFSSSEYCKPVTSLTLFPSLISMARILRFGHANHGAPKRDRKDHSQLGPY